LHNDTKRKDTGHNCISDNSPWASVYAEAGKSSLATVVNYTRKIVNKIVDRSAQTRS